MMIDCMICIGLFVIIVVTIILISRCGQERFQHVGQVSTLPDGVYTITSADGKLMKSDIVDTVMCKDFQLGQQVVPEFDGWQLNRVSQGVYKLTKPGDKQCLYASPANELRMYNFPTCDGANLCGLNGPNYKGELDGDSLRSYFMILQHPSGKFYLKNMMNNLFVTSTNNRIMMTKQPDEQSLFDIAAI